MAECLRRFHRAIGRIQLHTICSGNVSGPHRRHGSWRVHYFDSNRACPAKGKGATGSGRGYEIPMVIERNRREHCCSHRFNVYFGGILDRVGQGPSCEEIDDIVLVEDGGGQIISLPPICSDDITNPQDLVVSAVSSDELTDQASGSGGLLTIEPLPNANGVASVAVTVFDESNPGKGHLSNDSPSSMTRQRYYLPPFIIYRTR